MVRPFRRWLHGLSPNIIGFFLIPQPVVLGGLRAALIGRRLRPFRLSAPVAAICSQLTWTGRIAVKRLMLSVAAAGISSTTAFAMPLFPQAGALPRPTLIEKARIVCAENGFCYRLPGRRPVARW